MHKIKHFFKRVRNLYRWLPIIWKDQDWDYWHTFEILKTKLKFQSEHFRKYGYHVSSERDAERMELCIRLIDKVQNEYYLDEQLMKKDPVTDKDIKDAIRRHDKAKKLLFSILENNIESWWD
jgi:hypothetical protein